MLCFVFFFSSRRRHTRWTGDWSSDVCSSDLTRMRFVHRLRDRIIPDAAFPSGIRVLAGGGPAQGVDFLSRAYSYFPWLVLGVLVLTYVLLLRAFRSLILPLKAVVLNLLSVGAAYGMLVVFFRWGLGSSAFGLYQ